eukprot:TRINITY_DN8682_c0_g1_i2.p2 TRINITY_DN8682_c0_g1~~TRINITY_DN8682_c0_g1_i2.p2  ORF type:complete len:159 (-),score=41.40 TRINITY_DN8682_c0_g1_i2:4-480(-)
MRSGLNLIELCLWDEIHDEGVVALCEAIIANPTVKSLELWCMEFKFISSSKIMIIIIGTEMSHVGAGALANVLMDKNTQLEEFSLCCNPIGDKGMELIAKGFQANKSLKKFKFTGLEVSDIGRNALLCSIEGGGAPGLKELDDAEGWLGEAFLKLKCK